MPSALRVLFLSVEVEGLAKTGGLGDVAAALPKALRHAGVDVRICMPRYGTIFDAALDPEPVVPELRVPIGNWSEPVAIRQTHLHGQRGSGPESDHEPRTWPDSVPVYLVESRRYFGRESIYGHADDGERFILYCRAALEMCRVIGWAPDVIHCNDWHTALVPNWLATIYKDDPFFSRTATVYTIHNLAYQGIFDFHFLWLAGIAEHGFIYPQIGELAQVVDLMGRGILFADAVTTVSQRYAREILTPEYGERLDPLLRERQDRLFGILNGIDVGDLDPYTDPRLHVNFDARALGRRVENKLALQREAGLAADAQTPVIGMVGRLSSQKGLDIVAPVLEGLMRQRVHLVLLGTGDPHYHEVFERAERAHPDRARAFLTFDTPLAQRIYGGCDVFLMPSRYEPCGLGQMIAMRYGAVPVVRETGGLADTVQNWDPARGEGNGFTFGPYEPLDLFAALIRAAETFRYPDVWRTLQARGMAGDFSWERSARKYREVYAFAAEKKAGGSTA